MRVNRILALCTIVIFYLIISYCYANEIYSFKKNSYTEDMFHYLDNNFYEYYSVKNNSVLNLAPKVYFKGLDNRNINFTVNNLKVNGLNLPINNFYLINKYFLSSITVQDYNNTDSSIFGREFINFQVKDIEDFFINNQKIGVSFNTNFKTGNPLFENTITQQNHLNNFRFVFGINYTHLKHGLNHNINGYDGKSMLNSWNSFIDFEYKPEGQNVVFRFTNLNYLNSEHKLLQDKKSEEYFKADILKQSTIGNISIFSYEDKPIDSPLWHYTSSLAISNQNIVVNSRSKLLSTPQLYYENIAYKAQNVSKIELLNNPLELTYGVNINRDITKHHKHYGRFLWVKGKESTYQSYITNRVNTFNLDHIFFTQGVAFSYTSLKPEGLKRIKHNTFIPSLDIELIPIKNIVLYGNYLYDTRVPHIYERYINGEYFYNDYFVKFLPNPNLREERSNKFTSGLKIAYTFYDDIKIYSNVSAFYYKIHNYIDYHFLNTEEVIFANLHRAMFRGYNIVIGCDLGNFCNQITYNTVTTKDNNGNSLNNVTPNYFIVDSCYKCQTIKFTPIFRAKFFNSFNSYSDNYPYKKSKVPGYGLIDLYLKYNSSKDRVILALGVENVFNKKYYLPYIISPYRDRTYFVNLTINL